MFAAESLVRTLINQGVEVCFTNPGTSEMHMVAALDRIEGMRSVLCLFEGVATGAADGYARMAGKPACTLLHLGPGVGNGLANLHNAQRGHAPVVNIVGDHARDHLALDAPLTSDVEGVCRPMSRWVGRVGAPSEVSAMAVEAVRQAYGPERGVASLILPADCAWSDAEPEVLPATAPPAPSGCRRPGSARSRRRWSRRNRRSSCWETTPVWTPGSRPPGRIAAATGATLFMDTFVPRIARGHGRVSPRRLAYFGEQALEELAGTDLLVIAVRNRQSPSSPIPASPAN